MPFPDMLGPSRICTVARRLGPVAEDVVFLGGAVVPLLITDPVAPVFRATRNVDFVTAVSTRSAYADWESHLRTLDFQHDTTPGAPLCRWIADGIVVDAMPDDASILGFSNPWYPYALASSWRFSFGSGETVRVVSAPAFLLTKWAAFQDRGRGTDYYASHDLEDVLTVVDGRAELADEVAAAPPVARAAVQDACARLLADGRFLNALPGLVEPGRDRLVASRLAWVAR